MLCVVSSSNSQSVVLVVEVFQVQRVGCWQSRSGSSGGRQWWQKQTAEERVQKKAAAQARVSRPSRCVLVWCDVMFCTSSALAGAAAADYRYMLAARDTPSTRRRQHTSGELSSGAPQVSLLSAPRVPSCVSRHLRNVVNASGLSMVTVASTASLHSLDVARRAARSAAARKRAQPCATSLQPKTIAAATAAGDLNIRFRVLGGCGGGKNLWMNILARSIFLLMPREAVFGKPATTCASVDCTIIFFEL